MRQLTQNQSWCKSAHVDLPGKCVKYKQFSYLYPLFWELTYRSDQEGKNNEWNNYYYYNSFTALCPGLPGWAIPEETFTNSTYSDRQSSFICFLHLLRSIASFLYNLHTWQSFCTTSLQVYLLFWQLDFTETHTHTQTHTDTRRHILRLSGFCSGQPRWAGNRRNIHPLTPIVVMSHPLSASSICYDPWHPPCSIYITDSISSQCLSKFSLVYLLASYPQLHNLYISSPNHCLLFATHGHTTATCFTVVPRLCHLILVSLSTLYFEFYLVASQHTSI